MPSVVLASSGLAGGRRVRIDYQRHGEGPALVFLHGGWGYDIYPIDVAAFSPTHTVLVPSRSGYGRSSPLDAFPPEFHRRAVDETVAFLDRLGLERVIWWGHSDGAVIAALAAIHAPDHVHGLILEAVHFFADKPRSRDFFAQMASDPEAFGARIRRTLAAEHGEARWAPLMRLDGQAWLDLAQQAAGPAADLYQGRLPEVGCPVLVVQGGRDPRTEPGELEAVMTALPRAMLSFHPEAGHSPHSESSSAAVTQAVLAFVGSRA